MNHNLPKGLRLKAVYRGSSLPQENTIDRQQSICLSYVEQKEIEIVEEIKLEGKSGTQGEQLDDLYAIVQQKLDGEDFDGLLFSDYSRVARIAEDADRFYLACADAGLIIVTQKQGLLRGKDGGVERAIAGRDSEAFGQQHAIQTQSGVMSLIMKGLLPHTNLAPFGTDRLLISSKGVSLCILRRLPGGRTLKLSPTAPYEVEEEFVGNERRGCAIRQRNQRLTLIPGEQHAVETVKRIFKLFLGGTKPYSIAKALNTEGRPAPEGGLWTPRMVTSVLENGSYVGVAVSGRWTGSAHVKRRAGSPEVYEFPRRPGFTKATPMKPKRPRARIPIIERPMSDWKPVRLPFMLSFFDKAFRRRVKAWRRQWRKLRDRPKRTRRSRVQLHATFFLSGLITMRPDGRPMVGNPSMPNDRVYRYYMSRRQERKPRQQTKPLPMLHADLIENGVLGALQEVFSGVSGLRSKIADCVQLKWDESVAARTNRQRLINERDETQNHLRMILRRGPRARKLAEEDADRLEARLEQLEAQIRLSESNVPMRRPTVDSVVESVSRQLGDLKSVLRDRPLGPLRRIVEVFCSRIDFFEDTREVEVEFRFPSWAISAADSISKFVRTDDQTLERFVRRPNLDDSIPIAKYHGKLVVGTKLRKPRLELRRAAA